MPLELAERPLVCFLTRNYRTWVLLLCYGFSFGVELTVNNNLPAYLSSQFGYSYMVAGALSSVFGLTNIMSRPCGEDISRTSGLVPHL